MRLRHVLPENSHVRDKNTPPVLFSPCIRNSHFLWRQRINDNKRDQCPENMVGWPPFPLQIIPQLVMSFFRHQSLWFRERCISETWQTEKEHAVTVGARLDLEICWHIYWPNLLTSPMIRSFDDWMLERPNPSFSTLSLIVTVEFSRTFTSSSLYYPGWGCSSTLGISGNTETLIYAYCLILMYCINIPRSFHWADCLSHYSFDHITIKIEIHSPNLIL